MKETVQKNMSTNANSYDIPPSITRLIMDVFIENVVSELDSKQNEE